MKMFITITLVLVLVLSLAACGGDNAIYPPCNSGDSNVLLADTEQNALTLERVKELSEKGDSLTWNDFERYDNAGDIGSGLYILKYPINDEYYLLVGGGPLEEPPLYILLCETETETSIDIRYEDIDKFIE